MPMLPPSQLIPLLFRLLQISCSRSKKGRLRTDGIRSIKSSAADERWLLNIKVTLGYKVCIASVAQELQIKQVERADRVNLSIESTPHRSSRL